MIAQIEKNQLSSFFFLEPRDRVSAICLIASLVISAFSIALVYMTKRLAPSYLPFSLRVLSGATAGIGFLINSIQIGTF